MSIKKVQYIHTATLKAESKDTIHTGIYPTENTKFRIKGQGRGYINGNWVCGFYPNSDSRDWRFFWFSSSQNLCMDWNRERISLNGWGGDTEGALLDFEIGNYYIKDMNTDTILAQGSHQGAPTAGYDIEVCVGSWWFEGIQIWDGDDLVFDGYAAVDDEGHIGIYDEVSGELKYNSSLNMAYESFPDPFISTLTIDALYAGDTICKRAYAGDTLVYGKPYIPPYFANYLHIDGPNVDRPQFAFSTDYIPNENTEVEMNIMITGIAGDVWCGVLSQTGNATGSNYWGIRAPSGTRWNGYWAGPDSEFSISDNPMGKLCHILWNNSQITINDTTLEYGPFGSPRQSTMCIGAWDDDFAGGPFRSIIGYYGEIIIRENGEIVRDFKPAYDGERAGYYESINDNWWYMNDPNNQFTIAAVNDIPSLMSVMSLSEEDFEEAVRMSGGTETNITETI